MDLERRDPLKDLAQLQDKMNRIFEDTLSLLRSGEGKEVFASGEWVPPVDIYETEDSLVISADLPGMKKEEIVVEIADNTLTLKGERKFEREDHERNYSRVERPYGSFRRVFTLPPQVQKDKVKARYENGILEIAIEKVDESKGKQVKVKVE